MAMVKLQYMTADGEWRDDSEWEVEAFVARYRGGMWTGEVNIVRDLRVGESYHGGGGTIPEWRVERIG